MSLRSRVLGHLDAGVSPYHLRRLFTAAHELAQSIVVLAPLMSFEEWLATCTAYTTGRRNILRAARTRAELTGLSRAHARIQAFLKFEKLTSEGDPRVIQPTTDEYLTMLGPLIKPVDKSLSLSRYEFTKGLSYKQLGRLFASHLRHYVDPVVISVDYSRFDAHVSADLLAVEHYLYCLVTDDEQLATMLAWQVNTAGKTRSGFEYFRSGGRCSGHPNTSCGNAVLNLLMHRVVLYGLGIRASVFVNGDDALLIVERADAQAWSANLYIPFGMSLEGTVSEPDWAEYCSGRFMPYGDGYLFVRDLPKALFKLPWALKKVTAAEAKLRRHDVLHAELSQQPCVPLFTAFCSYYHNREPCRVPDVRVLSWHMQELDTTEIEILPIRAESREWFHRVYGVEPQAQVQAEAEILSTGWSRELSYLARAGFQPLVDARETHGSIFHHWNLTYCPAIDQECHHAEGQHCVFAQHSCCRDSSYGPCWDYAEPPSLPKAKLLGTYGQPSRRGKPRHLQDATTPVFLGPVPSRTLPRRNGAWEKYCSECRAPRSVKRLGNVG